MKSNAMKLVHISDTHINPAPILDSDPVANFQQCLKHISENHSDAEMVAITGDLTHHGLEQSYRMLSRMLADWDLDARLVIGNHDDRDTFLRVFPDSRTDAHGYVQWVEHLPEGDFIFMDTNQPGTHLGFYCEDRRNWLELQLLAARQADRPAWLFMHHNPMPVHVANADIIGIVHETELRALLAAFTDTVRHIFFGHCHYTLSGSVEGIPVSAPKSTNHPNWPDFSGDPHRVGYGGIARSYNLCFLGARDTVVHSIDFIEESQATWVETRDDGWIEETVPEDTRVPA